MEEKNRFVYTKEDAKGCKLINNDILVCKNCVYKFANTASACAQYDNKPVSILGGGKCSKYVEE